MLLPLALALTVVADPRPALVELQLAGRPVEALALAEKELKERPEASRQLGLDYARGSLLSLLGRSQEAGMAFAAAMGATPKLTEYSRYRMALEQDRQGHPEVAAGLAAKVASNPQPSSGSPLIADAVRLLARTLAAGGDCRVLRHLKSDHLPALQRRELLLAQADCAMRSGLVEMSRSLLVGLLKEEKRDDFARGAAERLSGMVSTNDRGPLPMLLGVTFHQHREFGRASDLLRRSLGARPGLPARELFDAQLALGRAQLSQQQYNEAALTFASLVARARTPEERAEGLFAQGQTFEQSGNWGAADTSFRLAYQAQPASLRWSALSLLSALRIEWRTGATEKARGLYDLLWTRPNWRREACRAALFLAASDLAQGRRDRATPWLNKTVFCNAGEKLEASYWKGRLAELQGNPGRAVAFYLEVVRADPYHPLARPTWVRMGQEPLASQALAQGRILAASTRIEDLHGAMLLLRGPESHEARKKLEKRLAADKSLAPYLTLGHRPVQRWPLWNQPLAKPEEMLLALGAWHEGSSEIARHFPVSDPSLAVTGADLLARAGDPARASAVIDELRTRIPQRFPVNLLPRPARRLQYPFLYREAIIATGRIRGVPTALLAALIREESHFDATALSPATTRGLTQLSLPTAKRLAEQLNLARLEPEDLYRPELSIALGAAHLGILLRQMTTPHLALAAYNGGEREAISWKKYCFGAEPEEYYAKIGTEETRDYVRRVLTAQAQYAELYP